MADVEVEQYDRVSDWLYEVEGRGDESPLTPYVDSIGINRDEPITEIAFNKQTEGYKNRNQTGISADSRLCVTVNLFSTDEDRQFDFYRDGIHIALFRPAYFVVKGTKYEGGQWDTTKKSA
jgi:hypothetical protein